MDKFPLDGKIISSDLILNQSSADKNLVKELPSEDLKSNTTSSTSKFLDNSSLFTLPTFIKSAFSLGTEAPIQVSYIPTETPVMSPKVNETFPLLSTPNPDSTFNCWPDDPAFTELVQQAEVAIELGVSPLRISQGSSGSYFIRNSEERIIGVFKPKDEEPYGRLNPKWTKWIHKLCCPCCFGRNCLVPNQGYLSEAAASHVDQMLGLGIVPSTKIVKLASAVFNYSKIDREKSIMKQRFSERFPEIGRRFSCVGLRRKVGSFQKFVEGYMDANYWLRRFEQDPDFLTKEADMQFQMQFEKMVVLDYVIRNTDRGCDNWLIKVEESKTDDVSNGSVHGESVSLAAIDNGLSFPFKHPDEWRAYPYHWTWLPMARRPFSESIKAQIRPLLSNQAFVEDICQQLTALFKIDKGFDSALCERQMAIVRGQCLNLSEALKGNKSPADLVQIPVVTIEKLKTNNDAHLRNFNNPLTQRFQDKSPMFSWF